MSRFLSGANRIAQYYQGRYPSASTFSQLEKFLIHTTETRGWPGYGGGASAPNATYYPERREIRQHFDSNRSARALRDPSGTAVRENRDNIFQLEVICYSSYSLVERFGGLWVGDLTDTHMRDIAEVINQLHDDWDLPIQSSVTWREGRRTFYDNVRLSGRQFDAYRGILGHVHASGNSHWDPGGFRYSHLERHLNGDDDVRPSDWSRADKDAVKSVINSTVISYTDKNLAWHLRRIRDLLERPVRWSDGEERTSTHTLSWLQRAIHAITDAQDGLDTAAILARIDQRADEDAARDQAVLDAIGELESGNTDAALGRLRDLLNTVVNDA